MKVLLNGSTEETLNKDNTKTQVRKERREKEQAVIGPPSGSKCFCFYTIYVIFVRQNTAERLCVTHPN